MSTMVFLFSERVLTPRTGICQKLLNVLSYFTVYLIVFFFVCVQVYPLQKEQQQEITVRDRSFITSQGGGGF